MNELYDQVDYLKQIINAPPEKVWELSEISDAIKGLDEFDKAAREMLALIPQAKEKLTGLLKSRVQNAPNYPD